MKTIAAALIACALLAGCKTATSTTNPTSPGPTNFRFGRGDGQTMTSAVEIRTRSEIQGGLMIREWIKQRYPGFTIQEQELIEQRDRAYNMITIIGPTNTAHRIYFDISTYYRRIGNENFPRAPG